MTDFIQLVNLFGVPVAVMAVMGYFFWSVAKWFKPRADQIIDAHLGLIDAIKENNSENSQRLRELAEKAVCKYTPPNCPPQAIRER